MFSLERRLSARESKFSGFLLRLAQRLYGLFGVDPLEDLRVYRDSSLGLIVGFSLIAVLIVIMEDMFSSVYHKKLFWVSIGVIAVCMLLARGGRLRVLGIGFGFVTLRGLIGLLLRPNEPSWPWFLALTVASRATSYFLLWLSMHFEEGTNNQSHPEG